MKNYASKGTPHGINVGDLFSMSWGYDQTNVDSFQVVRVSDAGVWVREIGAKHVEGSGGFMCQDVMVAPNTFLERGHWCGESNKPTFRRINVSIKNDGTKSVYFNFRGRYFASPTTTTETHYNSWYA